MCDVFLITWSHITNTSHKTPPGRLLQTSSIKEMYMEIKAIRGFLYSGTMSSVYSHYLHVHTDMLRAAAVL